MGKLTDINLLTECPHCIDEYGLPVVLEYFNGTWQCPECGEEFK